MSSPSPAAAASQEVRDRDALVVGEAVLLDLRPASFATRLLSFLIDGIVQLAIIIGGMLALGGLATTYGGMDDNLATAVILLIVLTGFIGYPVLTELLLNGGSLGRLALGTRVVRDDGGPVHLRQSILRAVMAMFEIWGTTGAVALVCSLIDRRSRRLGDLIAGTMVIQERLRAPRPVRASVPPALAEWAAACDLGRPDRDLMAEIRAFLPRAASLNPASRRAIALELVQRTMPMVSPPPPPGTDPEQFLTAVLAERSRRDEQRLLRARQSEERLMAEVGATPFSR